MVNLPDISQPTILQPRPRTASKRIGAIYRSLNWPFWFAILYVACQVGLLFLGSTAMRVPLRVGTYSASLLMLLLPAAAPRHPAAKLVPLMIVPMLPNLFMAEQHSVTAAIAQVMLYFSIVAPLFWVASSPLSGDGLRRVILCLWGFSVASACVGIIQVYNPGQFQAQLSSVVQEKGTDYVNSLSIHLANGTTVLRPMGLTDLPGGAANGAINAILLGIGLFYTSRNTLLRAISLIGVIAALFIIYLTHVRVVFVTTGIGVSIIAILFVKRRDSGKALSLLLIMLATVAFSTIWAFTVGGQDTIDRFSTLIEGNPAEVYSQNRGQFLGQTFNDDIWEYPFGAGAGRWGMIGYYFGDYTTVALWAEIMWSAWIFDGGIALMLVYCAMIASALAVALKIASERGGELPIWASVILALDIAALAATFDSPVFATQGGLEFWFINACLFSAWTYKRRCRVART